MVAIDKPIALVVGAGDHLGSAIARRFARGSYQLVHVAHVIVDGQVQIRF